jgi:tetratricopeptide (TPR) repeat protein
VKPYSRIIFVVFIAAVLAVAINLPAARAAGAPDGDPPLAVRRVLADVGPLMERKAYDQAVARLEAFRSEVDGRHPMVGFVLGSAYLLQNDFERAKGILRPLVAERPAWPDAWLNLAKACYETGDYGAAADCFAAAYEHSAEKDPQHLYFCATARMLAKQNTGAVAAFERLFQAHPGQVKAQWKEHYVHALLAVDQPRRALPLVKELARIANGEARVRWQELTLHLCLQAGMNAEARAMALDLTREEPTTARWWKALAHVELSAGRHAEALAALTVYGYLQPLTEAEQQLWADLNLQLDIPGRAAPVYDRLLQHKNDPKLIEKLISAYRQEGRYDESLALLDRNGADDPAKGMLRADLLYSARRFTEAAEAYRRAALKNKDAAGQAWLMAGYAAWQDNDLETSRQAFRRASVFKQHKKAALSAIQQIEAIN